MIEMINAACGQIRVNCPAQLLQSIDVKVLNGWLENDISKCANLFNEKIAGI